MDGTTDRRQVIDSNVDYRILIPIVRSGCNFGNAQCSVLPILSLCFTWLLFVNIVVSAKVLFDSYYK